MSFRARFLIRAEPSSDNPQTTVPYLIWMQSLLDEDNDEKFVFPEEFKALIHHERLFTLPPAIAAKRGLVPRWTKRTFKVILPKDIAAEYFDEIGNPHFMSTALNIFEESDMIQPPTPRARQTVLAEPSSAAPVPAPRSLSSVTKDAVISKYSIKCHLNAEAWLDQFETECTRLEIPQHRFWEVMRLFLEDGAGKWYVRTRQDSNSTAWEFWKSSFLENFGSKGIAAARSAFAFRYINGSLNDYCQSKLSLLSSFNPKMHELDRIAHVTLGLPAAYQDRINFTECTTLGKLLSTINSFDKPVSRFISNTPAASNSSPSNAFSSIRQRTLCPYCKKKGFERNHPEKDCLEKFRDNVRKNNSRSFNSNNNNVKASPSPSPSINSLDLQDLQQEVDNIQKNE